MFIKIRLGSDKLYAIANLFFAGANAISSFLIVKIFGLRLYGIMSYFNSIDIFIDYVGGHVRATLEYISAKPDDQTKVIQSFACLQLILSFISFLFFSCFSLFEQDPVAAKVCQIFIFLSPGKSYLSFFRILSKVSGSLKCYSITVIILSILNIALVFLTGIYFDFYTFLILRAALLIFSSVILYFLFSLSVKNFVSGIAYAISVSKSKSKSILFYGFISVAVIALDKIIIKSFFGAEILGAYSLSFLAYNMILIFGCSLIGGNFKNLTKCRPDHYQKVLNDSLFWTIVFIMGIEVMIKAITNYPSFQVFEKSIHYLVWLFPATIFSIIVQISYIFLISKKLLGIFNKIFLYATCGYLLSAVVLSSFFESAIWFSILFLFHQVVLVLFLSLKFKFLFKIFKKSFTNSWVIIFVFIIFHICFFFF